MKKFAGLIREIEEKDIPEVESILGLYWEPDLRDRFLKRVKDCIAQTPEAVEQKYNCFVAEEGGEVVGLAVARKAPEHMAKFATTANPAEFYLLAVKHKRRGIGQALRNERMKRMRELGFTEAVLFSAESHRDSWAFHDNSEFKRVGEAVAPNGEAGLIWSLGFE